MKRLLRRGFLVLGSVLGLAVMLTIGLVIFIWITWSSPIARPAASLTAPRDQATVERGRHLYVYMANCWDCHGSKGSLTADEPQAGGRLFDLSRVGPGFGSYYATNLTPDPETGIGSWSDGELVRALREGINRQGQLLFPVMPYQFYHGLSDTDTLAIIAYMRTFEPVRNSLPPRRPSFPAKALIALGILKPEPTVTRPVQSPPAGASAEYGRYLAWHASGCAECHMPRFARDGSLDMSRVFAGGLFPFPEKNLQTTGSNLTPDLETGLGGWTEEQFLRTMRRGTRPDGRVLPTFMPWPLYSHWSEQDLRAVWQYLRSLPPKAHPVPRGMLTGAAAGKTGAERGEALYEVYCLMCHGRGGQGTRLIDVSLADMIAGADEAGLITMIRSGLDEKSSMPAFEKTLTPDQVRDILSYLREASSR